MVLASTVIGVSVGKLVGQWAQANLEPPLDHNAKERLPNGKYLRPTRAACVLSLAARSVRFCQIPRQSKTGPSP